MSDFAAGGNMPAGQTTASVSFLLVFDLSARTGKEIVDNARELHDSRSQHVLV